MGKAVLLDGPCVTNQQINTIVPDERKVDRLFLYYALLPRRPELFRLGSGGSRTPILNKSQFERFPIKLPPIQDQRAVAAVLGVLDDRIELDRRMNETLEAIARAIFKSWFVDFDPVRAKAAGREPTGMSATLATFFPSSFELSALGNIPLGWRADTLEAVLSVLETGARPQGGVSGYTKGIPSIGAESVVGLAKFDYSKTKYVPIEFYDSMTRGRLGRRDVLLYKDGGRPGEFEPHVALLGDGFPFDKACINEHVYRLGAKPEYSDPFLYFWLTSEPVMEEMRRKGTGVAIPGLNSTAVRSLQVLVPDYDVIKVFDRTVEPLVAQALLNAKESCTLASLRDALLPKLMSGEIKVKQAEKAVEAVV